MLLRETGFAFNGIHSYGQMGFYYSESGAAHTAWPQVTRSEYEIAGRSGTVLMPGEQLKTLTFSGALYPRQEPKSQADAQRMIRRAQEWLLAGRCPLVFDYEPEVYYLAQLSRAAQWSLKNWFGGELSISFDAQPYAYAAAETKATAATTGTSVRLSLRMATLWPAPINLKITNTGTDMPITDVSVRLNDEEMITLSGYTSFTRLVKMYLNSDTPAGCELENSVGKWSGMMRATKFQPMMAAQGENRIDVTLTYSATATGTPGASIEAAARGRW